MPVRRVAWLGTLLAIVAKDALYDEGEAARALIEDTGARIDAGEGERGALNTEGAIVWCTAPISSV